MNPVFLVGAERSGTTLLRLMLDAHPAITWLSEFEYAVDFMQDDNDTWPDVAMYIEWLNNHRIFRLSGLKADSTLSYQELVNSFLEQEKSKKNCEVLGATCHRHYDRLVRLFPDSRFIYLIRDPRDVARSNIGMGWSGNVWYGVEQWIEAETLWKNVKNKLPEKQWIEVYSERLIVEPVETLTRICKFLGLEYEESMLEYPKYTTYKSPDPSLTEQWKRKLSPKDIYLVEYRAGQIMRERGYDIVTDVNKPPSILTKIFLFVQNKYYKIKFRIQRYGLLLYIAELMARKLKISAAEKLFKRRMHKIDNSMLK